MCLRAAKAKGIVTIDNAQYPLEKNNLLIVSKGQAYHFSTNTLCGYRLQCDDAFWKYAHQREQLQSLFDAQVTKHKITVSASDLRHLVALFKTALSDYIGPDYSNKPDVLAA
ncbi:hypothetical protein GCM10028819_14300 [Spirosoma humi]